MSDYLSKYAYGISAACLACALQSREQAPFWHEHFVIALLIGLGIPLNVGAGLALSHMREHLMLYVVAGLFMACGIIALSAFMFVFADGLGFGFLIGSLILIHLFGQLVTQKRKPNNRPHKT